ncbi:MAG: ATP-binding protein [Candidatus Aenigmarchaeota archaeon]|nr:ATP-binding protein [Candidatus Aenigmarchaeota archaeon]
MLKPPKIGLVIGKRGSGKTTLAKEILKNNERFIVYDVNFEYSAKELRAVPVYFFNDLKLLLQKNEPRIVFKPRRAVGATFEFFCATIWLYATNYLLVISEFDSVVNKAGNYFFDLVHRGRHKNLGMLGDARRPFGIPRIYLTQLDILFIGLMKPVPEDFRYLREFLPKEASEKLATIERFKFLRWVDEPEQFGVNESVRVVENKVPFYNPK